VIAGGRYIPFEALSRPDSHTSKPTITTADPAGTEGSITPRQREILALLRQGLPN
jgi:DNA-binding NarL/FixJ family response regulator